MAGHDQMRLWMRIADYHRRADRFKRLSSISWSAEIRPCCKTPMIRAQQTHHSSNARLACDHRQSLVYCCRASEGAVRQYIGKGRSTAQHPDVRGVYCDLQAHSGRTDIPTSILLGVEGAVNDEDSAALAVIRLLLTSGTF